MAWNKNALIRYKTIDKCLQNQSKQWTLDDLVEACSDALYEYEGKDVDISKRTVQLDIQTMRSDKLGYNAPIEVYRKKYYRYADSDYSITNIPITQLDMSVLAESMEMLKQFKRFSLFKELGGVIQRLEDKLYHAVKNQRPIIHLDKNDSLKGLEHLDTLYQAIQKKIVLEITYQSFWANSPNTFNFHGYILKEFNNRWFLVGKRTGLPKIRTLALDRMHNVTVDLKAEYESIDFDADDHYRNTYGVTVLGDAQIITIEMVIDRHNAPYVLTKPFHQSQELLEEYDDGSIRISIRVHQNAEIERLQLGFADSIEVLNPPQLRKRMKERFEYALKKYE